MLEAPTQSLRSLPLATIHLTERCNSRCVSCDYWRHGKRDITAESVAKLLPEFRRLGTHTILLSGGEPLIHPEWIDIATLLRSAGMHLWLVTSGLSLVKHAQAVASNFKNVSVSLDGVDREMYARIRGVNAFDKVCAGMRAIAALGVEVNVRVTIQHDNFAFLSRFVALARECGAAQISFLAADVSNATAFGRQVDYRKDIALEADDLPKFKSVLNDFEKRHADDFRSRFIAENPAKLKRLHEYFTAICGLGAFPVTRCNAPEFSAVIETDGSVKPCFFIPAPASVAATADLESQLNSKAMLQLREAIRSKQRPECTTCVCSLWREPHELERPGLRAQHVELA